MLSSSDSTMRKGKQARLIKDSVPSGDYELGGPQELPTRIKEQTIPEKELVHYSEGNYMLRHMLFLVTTVLYIASDCDEIQRTEGWRGPQKWIEDMGQCMLSNA